MTTFIDWVKISGVKAISGSIEIDLRSPLVVLYAPNGTGKTSVWQAIRDVMGDFREPNLKCTRDDAEPLKIIAKIRTKSGAYNAIRSGDNRLRLEPTEGSAISGTEALKLIAPECSLEGMQSKGAAVQNRLQDYIRATRSLPADSLSYLIDDSEDSSALRRQIFADLTGTSSLQVEQRELQTYRARLLTARDDLNREKTRRVSDFNAQNSAVNLEASDLKGLLIEAAGYLNLPIDLAVETEALTTLKSAYSSRFAAHDNRREQIDELRDVLARRDPSLSVDAISDEIGRLKEAIREAEAELAVASKEKQEKLSGISSLKTAEARLNVLLAYLGKNINSVISYIDISPSTSLAEIKGRLKGRDREVIAGNILLTQRQLSDLESLKAASEEHSKVAFRAAELVDLVGKAGDPKNLREQLSQIENKIEKKTENRAKLDQLRILLRDTARQILVISPSNHCPCCSHQWQSENLLVDAISSAVLLELSDSEQLEELQGACRDLTSRLAEATKLQHQLDQVSATMQSLSIAIDKIRYRLEDVDTSPDGVAQLHRTLELEKQSLHLHEFLEAVTLGYPDIDEQSTLGSLLDKANTHSRKINDNLLDLQEELDVTDLREKEVRSIVEGKKTSIVSLESRLSETKKLDGRRGELSVILGLSADVSRDFQDLQAKFSAEGQILKNIDELLRQATRSLGSARAKRLAEEIFSDIQKIQKKIDVLNAELKQADELIEFIEKSESEIGSAFFNQLGPAIATLFNHMQVNRIFQDINISVAKQSFSLSGSIDNAVPLSPEYFSSGQRQDLALSMFLARACTLGGSYLLDEPLLHLDDLNRTALLDCVRACVLGTRDTPTPVKLLITTANWSVARQFIQKFSNVRASAQTSALTVYSLTGNVNVGVKCERMFPVDTVGTLQ